MACLAELPGADSQQSLFGGGMGVVAKKAAARLKGGMEIFPGLLFDLLVAGEA